MTTALVFTLPAMNSDVQGISLHMSNMANGEFDSLEALAAALGVNVSYVRRFLRLALLAPPIVEAIMAGKAPRTLSLTKLDTNLPWAWQEQLKLFGMA